jgi:recA bacterial DNA recombination protein
MIRLRNYYMKYVEKEITLAELADRFLSLNDFETPEIYDMGSMGIEVETIDPSTGDKAFRPIKNFVVKNTVSTHYTDGVTKGTANHRVIEGGKEVRLEDHPEFRRVEEQINVVDIEVEEFASYLANGRLHHNTTSGGKAIAFHASTRIRLSLVGKIQDANKNVVGVNVKAVVVKNRLGPPHRTAEFDIYFDRGIDDYSSWLDVLKENNLVKQSGAWYTLVDETTGEEIKFQSKDFPNLLESNITRKESIYQKICDTLIMKYKSEYDPDAMTLDMGDGDSKELLLD